MQWTVYAKIVIRVAIIKSKVRRNIIKQGQCNEDNIVESE